MGKNLIGRAVLAVILSASATVSTAAGQDCDVRGVVETPPDGATITELNVVISGWAADLAAASGSGVNAVRVALDADPDQSGVPLPAQNGWERPDVAALLGGPRFLASGFALTWNTTGVPAGSHTLYVQVRTACGWTSNTRTVSVAPRAGAASGVTSSPAGRRRRVEHGARRDSAQCGPRGRPDARTPARRRGHRPSRHVPDESRHRRHPRRHAHQSGAAWASPAARPALPAARPTIPGAAPTASVPGTSPLPPR